MHKKRFLVISFSAVIAVVLAMIFLYFVPGSDREGIKKEQNRIDTSQPLVQGATGKDVYYVSENRSGLFYLEGSSVHYIDYRSRKDYALCNKPNCNHKDTSCYAYVKNAAVMAAWKGTVYVFSKNDEKNTWDLLSMSLTGQNRKTIASIKQGSYDAGNYILNDLKYSDIYFGYGNAYVTLNYEKVSNETGNENSSITRLITINLKSGKMKTIAEESGTDNNYQLQFKAINEKHVIYSFTKVPDMLTAKEIEENGGSENVLELKKFRQEVLKKYKEKSWKQDLYSFYIEYARYFMNEQRFFLYDYDSNSKTVKQVYKKEKCDPAYDVDNNLPYGWLEPVEVLGWYDQKLVLSMDSQTKEKKDIHDIWIWDLGNKKKTHIKRLSNTGIIMVSFGNVGNYIRNAGRLFYVQYKKNTDSKTAWICELDIGSKKQKRLYEDSRNITFRFMGETGDYLIGDMEKNGKQGAYIIKTTDYLKGDLGKAKLLYNISVY